MQKKIHKTVVVFPCVKLGKNVIIKPYSIIGGDGFGYFRNKDFHFQKQHHQGGVIIKDNVHIGSCVCIDRGVNDNTLIGEGTKIDNLVHVAHNVVIGRDCGIVSGTVLGGSCIIGDRVFIGMNACIKPNIKIGDECLIGMGSVVIKDIPKGQIACGNPTRVLRRNTYFDE